MSFLWKFEEDFYGFENVLSVVIEIFLLNIFIFK